jgi:hypothetical protein
MWTRRSRRRPTQPSRKPNARRWHNSSGTRAPDSLQAATARPRRSGWRRLQMRLRALWRWGVAKLIRRLFRRRPEQGRSAGGSAQVHLFPEQRSQRYH